MSQLDEIRDLLELDPDNEELQQLLTEHSEKSEKKAAKPKPKQVVNQQKKEANRAKIARQRKKTQVKLQRQTKETAAGEAMRSKWRAFRR